MLVISSYLVFDPDAKRKELLEDQELNDGILDI